MAKQDLGKLIEQLKDVNAKREINTPIQKVVKTKSTEVTKPLHIHLPEELFYSLKQKALEQRTSVKNVVIEALKRL